MWGRVISNVPSGWLTGVQLTVWCSPVWVSHPTVHSVLTKGFYLKVKDVGQQETENVGEHQRSRFESHHAAQTRQDPFSEHQAMD